MGKKYYLVKEYKLFVDPHGTPDDGGVKKRVEFTDEYNDLDLSKTYTEDLEEVEEDKEYYGSEDGYNSEYIELSIKEISKEEYHKFLDIINDYNNL